MTNWYTELSEIHEKTPIIAITIGDRYTGDYSSPKNIKQYSHIDDVKHILDYDFNDGYGGTNGTPFTAWTADRVYFPACYDGSEWIASVPRNPCDEVTQHIGGG